MHNLILERGVYNRLYSFLNLRNILNNSQFGFRTGHSTSSALVDFTCQVSQVFDKSEVMMGLFLDLSKAFDTLDHNIILAKLSNYGIRGVLLNWFKSYLSNRKQFVKIKGNTSSMQTVVCGVPQGSILGPILFILSINDMCNISDKLKYILFADDTSVFMSHKNIQSLQQDFGNEINKLLHWLSLNKLILNVNKTNYMVFTKQKIDFNEVDLQVNNHEFKRVSVNKFLGIEIDSKLTWNEHTGAVCNKISKNTGILKKLRFLPKCVLRMLYNTLILPHLYYCSEVWAMTSQTNLNRILKMQKKAIRVISNSHYRAHSKPIFYNLKLLNVFDICEYHIAVFMYLCRNESLPCALSFDGPKIWNSIPINIRNCKSLLTFKRKYKMYLIESYVL